MISCKLEQVGEFVALVLDDDAMAALNVQVGDTVHLEPDEDGVLRRVARETWAEDSHARGRAFLRRYRRTVERLG
jgi:antitoxin component of MazEF toxin-antitoxin module